MANTEKIVLLPTSAPERIIQQPRRGRLPGNISKNVVSIQVAIDRRVHMATSEDHKARRREIELYEIDVHHAENVLAGSRLRLARSREQLSMAERGLL